MNIFFTDVPDVDRCSKVVDTPMKSVEEKHTKARKDNQSDPGETEQVPGTFSSSYCSVFAKAFVDMVNETPDSSSLSS